MVLDIRKELWERKTGHPITASIVNVRSRNADLRGRQPEINLNGVEAESIAGPCSPPAPVYSRKIDLLQPSGSYEQPRPPQPRPLRMPCSACTFVPAPHTHHNIQHNIDIALGQLSQTHTGIMRPGSQRQKMCSGKQRRKADATADVEAVADECVEIEEPGVEDIAGGHAGCRSLQRTTPLAAPPKFNTSFGSSIQPIRVACSACTSSLTAPLSYGERPPYDRIAPPARPKLPRKKRDKRPQVAESTVFSRSSAVEDMATNACTSQAQQSDGGQDLVEPLTTESSRGWYVRPEQGMTYMTRKASPAASDYAKSTIEEYISNSSLEDVVEAVGGANQHESLEVTYQSTRDREAIMQQFRSGAVKHRRLGDDNNVAAGHDCFVKRVERACATARSASAGSTGRPAAPMSASAPLRQHNNSRHMFYADYRRPTSRTNCPNRQRCPASADRDPTHGSSSPVADKDAASAPASSMNEAEDRAFARITGAPHRTLQFGKTPTVAAHADVAENIVQALVVSHDEGPISCIQDHTTLGKELQNRHHRRPYRPPHLPKKNLTAKRVEENGSKHACQPGTVSGGDLDNEEGGRSVGGQAKRLLIAAGGRGSEEIMSTPRERGRSAVAAAGGKGNNDSSSARQAAASESGNLSRSTAGGGAGKAGSGINGAAAAYSGAGSHDEAVRYIEEVARASGCSSDPRNSMQQQQQELKLSVEVFPSPSAPKGFGLKITQHFPKAPVQVEYVNSLGLSPRSFQTHNCQRCITFSSPRLV